MNQELQDAINRLNAALDNLEARQAIKDAIDLARAIIPGLAIPPVLSASATDVESWLNAREQQLEEIEDIS